MEVVCSGPFRVGSLVWQPRAGAHTQTIVCKATFDLAPDRCPLSATPANLVAFDEHEGRDPRKSLTAASDLVPFKPRPEVLLTGSAYAPQGRPVRHLLASLTIGPVDKSIAVHGDRCFTLDGALEEPSLFTRMPLVWERAAGGADTTNPVGMPMGDEARPDAWGRVHVPNLQPIATMITSRSDVVAPVCFAPIAREWPSRRARLHRHAQTWDPLRWIERPLPEDFEGAYFQDAPSDQWLTEIAPDEHLRLVGLHPHLVELSTRLTRAVPVAVLEAGGAPTPIRLRCDTIAIDTDRLTIALVYRGQVPLAHPQQAGRILVQMEVAQAPVSTPVPRWAQELPSVSKQTISPGLVASKDGVPGLEAEPPKAVLPFGTPESKPSDLPEEEPTHDVTALPFRPVVAATVGISALGRSMRLGQPHDPPPEAPALPAQPPPLVTSDTERPPPLADTPPPFGDTPFPPPLGPVTKLDLGGTPPSTPFFPRPPAADLAPSTPFFPPPPAADLPPSAPFSPPPPSGDLRRQTLILTTADLAVATPFSAASTPFTPASTPFTPASTPFTPASTPFTPAPTPAFVPPPTPLTDAPVPPPLGLLSLHAPSDAGEPVAEKESPAHDTAPPAAAPDAAPAPPLPLDDYPLERVARIDARIARRPPDEAKILDEERLDADLWKKLHEHWADALGAESRRGKSAKNRVYDAEYVAQIEAERGPIGATEYSKIIVAVERGAIDQTLSEMGIPKAGVIRIQRIWLQRILADPRAASEARAAIRAERELA